MRRGADYRRQSCEPRLIDLSSGLKRTPKPKGLVFGPKVNFDDGFVPKTQLQVVIPNENWHWCRGSSVGECGFGDNAMDNVVLVFRERELLALNFVACGASCKPDDGGSMRCGLEAM
ncbi:hypothetical protein D8674_041574 [Pyrus ussuriensis x Pyrus communis]|uniref:Uncharacterized protein n=1 Tax=Pyrus ussuriensis x Pyrus communis TaxID=2448454 RepID=A0A5N5FMG8_9ROSA|nr:hypothetical protein D8674_041574 [Pyrus ussuriensis x Pyrus communis]